MLGFGAKSSAKHSAGPHFGVIVQDDLVWHSYFRGRSSGVADFSSAVLMVAVQRALKRDGIDVGVKPGRDALVPLADKQRLLIAVADTHGLLPLLRVGSILPAMPADPAISALAAARHPADLFARWARLERFTHSQHQVLVRESGSQRLIAEHVGTRGKDPVPCEDALIVGVLAALLERIGTRGLAVQIGGQIGYSGGRWVVPDPVMHTSRWSFTWDAIDDAISGASPENLPSTQLLARARQLLGGDLGRRWTLSMLAEALGMSSRSLQRSLAPEGGFCGLIAAVRADAAARMLIDQSLPVSIIGFACGYADQPHFTRAFKQKTALTPGAYREAFARDGQIIK